MITKKIDPKDISRKHVFGQVFVCKHCQELLAVWRIMKNRLDFLSIWNKSIKILQMIYSVKSFDTLYHAQFMGIRQRIKIQKRMISINVCIIILTFVLHTLTILDSIVLESLPSIPSWPELFCFRVVIYNRTTTMVISFSCSPHK